MIAGLVEECSQPGFIPDAAVRLPLDQLLIPGNDCHSRQQGQLGLHIRVCRLSIHKEVEDRHTDRLMVLVPDPYLVVVFRRHANKGKLQGR